MLVDTNEYLLFYRAPDKGYLLSAKRNRNETKRNEINKNETKRNEINEMKTK